jgi:hypothetical protein
LRKKGVLHIRARSKPAKASPEHVSSTPDGHMRQVKPGIDSIAVKILSSFSVKFSRFRLSHIQYCSTILKHFTDPPAALSNRGIALTFLLI